MWKAQANDNEEANNVFSEFQSAVVNKTRNLIQVENNIENFSLHPSHPTLIQPDKQPNYPIPAAPKEPAFNSDKLNESLQRSIRDFKELEAKKVNELDDIAQSALSELTNMLTANAATRFSSLGILIDISTPTLLHGNNIALKMSSNQVLCIQLLADDIPIEVNIAFEN